MMRLSTYSLGEACWGAGILEALNHIRLPTKHKSSPSAALKLRSPGLDPSPLGSRSRSRSRHGQAAPRRRRAYAPGRRLQGETKWTGEVRKAR
ncbi:Hypothetical predicted protein [Podarcis lilfordi]|uniref:Uncharacterized protein n=1 Tax=Podarcis lilfordi TaxID=74358 RepID=A0AA35JNU2_9SAUR|nr:Hypothetical predicted protein [Podarcis lilfordi]